MGLCGLRVMRRTHVASSLSKFLESSPRKCDSPDSRQSSSLLRPNHLSFFWVPADGEAESSVSSSYLNAHSNPTIINPKKKSRYGQTLSPYDSGEEEELDDESDDDDDWSLNDDFAEVTEYEKKKPKSQKPTIAKKGLCFLHKPVGIALECSSKEKNFVGRKYDASRVMLKDATSDVKKLCNSG
ncbi:hypothetical protein YC2023_081661 [Brassica napus]